MALVDEIYPSDIKRSIGPAGTVKRLFSNRDYFASRGYEMHVFVPTGSGMGEMTELPQASGAVKTKNGWKDLLRAKKHTFVESNRITSAWALHRYYKGVEQFVDQYIALDRKPDIVVFHDALSCLLYSQRRKEKKAKLAMFVHGPGNDDNQFSQRRPVLVGTREETRSREILLGAFACCDQVVWISQNGKRVFLGNHPEYASKTSVVVNGINDMAPVDIPPSTAHRFRMVTTGTVNQRKGQYIIVEAMHKMDPAVLKDCHLTVMGIGPDYSRLLGLTEAYGLQEHITFLGNVPNAEVHAHLCAENIFVLMSRNEGLPISVIEAMRAGLPVISTRVDGIPEQVDGRNGILIDPDIDQLVAVLNGLPQYDWKQLGLNSRWRFEEEYTFERMLKDYADMFDRL